MNFMLKKLAFSVLFIIFISNVSFAQWIPEKVPDPILQSGFVSNPDKILSQNYVDSLNKIIKKAFDSNYVQVAVVALNSIGESDPKIFAADLFNLWKIGDKDKDNGLLILMVMDQRTVTFEVGYGIEDILTDAECYQIQQNYMVPFFKDEAYDQGILSGTIMAISEVQNNATIYMDNPPTERDDVEYDYNDTKILKPFWQSDIFVIYVVVCLLLIILFVILLFVSFSLSDRYKRYQTLRLFSLLIFPILFPIPFILIFFLVRFLLEMWRNTPRISPTGKRMRKLNEVEDDKYLEKGQVTEEKVKSVDYDVWITDDGQETLVLAYKRWFTKYSACPKCKYKTYFMEYDKVIRQPTYTSSGEGEKKYKCVNCGHSEKRRYTIPKKERTSSSSSSYKSFGGGGSYSGGGGGGYSWGGGSSGGGGASSKW